MQGFIVIILNEKKGIHWFVSLLVQILPN